MNLLLDTHIFIWAFSNVAQLSPDVSAALVSQQNNLFLSVASSWEMQVKEQIGKLTLSPSVEVFVKERRLNKWRKKFNFSEEVELLNGQLFNSHS